MMMTIKNVRLPYCLMHAVFNVKISDTVQPVRFQSRDQNTHSEEERDDATREDEMTDDGRADASRVNPLLSPE